MLFIENCDFISLKNSICHFDRRVESDVSKTVRRMPDSTFFHFPGDISPIIRT